MYTFIQLIFDRVVFPQCQHVIIPIDLYLDTLIWTCIGRYSVYLLIYSKLVLFSWRFARYLFNFIQFLCLNSKNTWLLFLIIKKSLFDKIIFKSEAKITIPILIILIIRTIKVEPINILCHVTNYMSYLSLVAKYTYLNWDDSFYIEV